MKRVLLAALTAGLAAAFAGAASADTTWTEPSGMFSILKPDSWEADSLGASNPEIKAYVIGNADEECYVIGFPRALTKDVPPRKIIEAWSVPFDPAKWREVASSQKLLGGQADLKVGTVDSTTGPFPIQFAILQGAEREVVAAVHPRPGLEIFVYCGAYDDQNHNAKFEKVAKSLTTPGDAAWKATLDAEAAAKAAKENGGEKKE